MEQTPWIDSLPHELLTMIFRYATQPRIEELVPTLPISLEDGLIDTVSTIRITHVCQLWRDIALKDPTLWTCVDSKHVARMDAYLTRSRKVPVSLCLHLNPWNLEEVVENLPALRLRRLDVEFYPLPKDLGPLMLLRAPNLECLTISSLEFVSIVRWPPYVQRTRLLSGEVTGLKALALQAMVTWLPTNHFPALTHLHLSIVSLHTPELRVSDILPLLANTPQLEFAHIARIIYSTIAEPPAPVVTPIMLPRLRSLACVSWAHVRAVTLLTYLELPDCCWVRFQDLAIDPSTDGYPEALRAESRHWLIPPTSKLRLLPNISCIPT